MTPVRVQGSVHSLQIVHRNLCWWTSYDLARYYIMWFSSFLLQNKHCVCVSRPQYIFTMTLNLLCFIGSYWSISIYCNRFIICFSVHIFFKFENRVFNCLLKRKSSQNRDMPVKIKHWVIDKKYYLRTHQVLWLVDQIVR